MTSKLETRKRTGASRPSRPPAPPKLTLQQNVSKIVNILKSRDDLSQEDLAETLKVAPSGVSDKLNPNQRRSWTIEDLQALSERFDVPPGIFFVPVNEIFAEGVTRRYSGADIDALVAEWRAAS